MFYIKHPRPVGDGRAVAMQIANQKQCAAVDKYVLIVEPAAARPAAPRAAPDDAVAGPDRQARPV
ncbi:hypothetical protein [Janthinobacterium fluminis]|uniref:Uncharacterized protein n=1 Tax=Janthinobacterium fluminis TaxID=2987524 RepID=A0ABT5JV46_9BURK|nr:hypothetical protein [Janthinobacterium fluminis]MDC8756594.1 hypothetical protein [Janthinobacterium fluminis]